MNLPKVSEEVVRGYAGELVRDVNQGATPRQIGEGRYRVISHDNPLLVEFMESMSSTTDLKEAAQYQLGFMQCYELLNRQAEVDDLERKAR